MAKTFYTERDIEELASRGVKSVNLNDDVVLTELAVEKADRLGVKLVREKKTAAPTAGRFATAKPASPVAQPANQPDLRQKVKAAVIARLGSEVDPKLLDTIINRVLDNVGVK